MRVAATPSPRGGVQRPELQISVVVANIQVVALKSEAEKGSSRTARVRGLADPKTKPQQAFYNLSRGDPAATLRDGERESGANVPEPMVGPCGDAACLGDGGCCPGKSYLFCLNAAPPRKRVKRRCGGFA